MLPAADTADPDNELIHRFNRHRLEFEALRDSLLAASGQLDLTPGGLTDRYLADYPNMFADMSAGSGLNALTRDEDHSRGFLDRHQDKILYGSDCDDRVGAGAACQGSQTIAAIRKLAPNKVAERKILYENSKKLFKLT